MLGVEAFRKGWTGVRSRQQATLWPSQSPARRLSQAKTGAPLYLAYLFPDPAGLAQPHPAWLRRGAALRRHLNNFRGASAGRRQR